MLIGVPKEIKVGEARVGLTPAAVVEYVAHGHDVLVETGAGAGIGAGDDVYRAAGATIAATAAEVFARADMIVKVKEPQPAEWAQLRPGQILFTYLHLAADPKQARGLMESGVTAIAYETVTDARGGLPLLAPMSEVAGRLSSRPRRRRCRSRMAAAACCSAAFPACQPADRGDRRRRGRHPGGADGGRPRRRGHHSRPLAAAADRARRPVSTAASAPATRPARRSARRPSRPTR